MLLAPTRSGLFLFRGLYPSIEYINRNRFVKTLSLYLIAVALHCHVAYGAGSNTTKTHCTEAETTLFSCNIGQKTVSVCAVGKQLRPQYRFGKLGHPLELQYPADIDSSEGISVEEQTDSFPRAHYTEWSIEFANGGVKYTVQALEPTAVVDLGPSYISISSTPGQLECARGSEMVNEAVMHQLAKPF